MEEWLGLWRRRPSFRTALQSQFLVPPAQGVRESPPSQRYRPIGKVPLGPYLQAGFRLQPADSTSPQARPEERALSATTREPHLESATSSGGTQLQSPLRSVPRLQRKDRGCDPRSRMRLEPHEGGGAASVRSASRAAQRHQVRLLRPPVPRSPARPSRAREGGPRSPGSPGLPGRSMLAPRFVASPDPSARNLATIGGRLCRSRALQIP